MDKREKSKDRESKNDLGSNMEFRARVEQGDPGVKEFSELCGKWLGLKPPPIFREIYDEATESGLFLSPMHPMTGCVLVRNSKDRDAYSPPSLLGTLRFRQKAAAGTEAGRMKSENLERLQEIRDEVARDAKTLN